MVLNSSLIHKTKSAVLQECDGGWQGCLSGSAYDGIPGSGSVFGMFEKGQFERLSKCTLLFYQGHYNIIFYVFARMIHS
jgi:hypothetical protein